MSGSVKLACKSCNKRAKAACKNQLCYKCCSKNLKKICPLHNEELIRKTEEERYIEEGLSISNAPNKKIRRFHHQESKLTDFHQTVVIWCLKDFCQNKGMSASTFTQLERAKSSSALKKKRNASGHAKLIKDVSDDERLRKHLTRNERKRAVKYKKVKDIWQNLLIEQEVQNNSTSWLVAKVAS